MKRIRLTQGQFALIDNEDYEFLNQWKWFAQKNYNTFYAGRKSNKGNIIYMHRVIMNAKSGQIIRSGK